MEAIDGHSGYEFSFSPFRLIPMSGSSQYHDYHQYLFNIARIMSEISDLSLVFGIQFSRLILITTNIRQSKKIFNYWKIIRNLNDIDFIYLNYN